MEFLNDMEKVSERQHVVPRVYYQENSFLSLVEKKRFSGDSEFGSSQGVKPLKIQET